MMEVRWVVGLGEWVEWKEEEETVGEGEWGVQDCPPCSATRIVFVVATLGGGDISPAPPPIPPKPESIPANSSNEYQDS